MAVQYYKINYKSDFVLTINSDAGWAVPFCIKFWTGMPSHGYFAGFDGENYVNCRVGETPTQLLVMFDDHHMPIGPLRMQIAYHTTIEEFPDRKFDEVTNPTNVTVDIDGTEYQVMLDFTGETGAEIDFSMPSSGVMSVNGKIGYVTLNAEDVGAQPMIEDLATIRSGAAAGATAVQPAELQQGLATKQNVIEDLATIRSGAAAGATAYQKPETGIPESDLASGVQSSLQKADAAAPQSNTYTKGEVDTLIEGAISDIDVDDALSTTSENPVQNKVVTTALNGKQTIISDLSTIRSGAAAGATAVQPAALTPIESDIDAIEGKIPSAASASNQLADKAFVNSALSDKADTSDIPTALSQLSQDSTHRVVTDTEKSTWNGKQNAIDDLATIRSGAAAGATAVQPAAMNTALAAKQDTINTVNVTVDNNTGTPSGSASVSGSTLSLNFQNLKGATGATGATGPQGPQGERGLPGESGVTGDVSGFTVIQTIDPSATYGATDIAGAATVQATNQELTELGGEVYKTTGGIVVTDVTSEYSYADAQKYGNVGSAIQTFNSALYKSTKILKTDGVTKVSLFVSSTSSPSSLIQYVDDNDIIIELGGTAYTKEQSNDYDIVWPTGATAVYISMVSSSTPTSGVIYIETSTSVVKTPVIGDIDNLLTEDKSNLVAAINELQPKVSEMEEDLFYYSESGGSDVNISSGYTFSNGQKYGTVGSAIQTYTKGTSYKWTKIFKTDDVSYVVVTPPSTGSPSSLIQYVDNNNIILELDATSETLTPGVPFTHNILWPDGATAAYITTATDTESTSIFQHIGGDVQKISVIGSLEDLSTTNKENLVAAINSISAGKRLRVMTWNIGHYSLGASQSSAMTSANYEENLEKWKKALTDINADIIGVQEYSEQFYKDTSASPQIDITSQNNVFDIYENKYIGLTSGYLGNAIFSRISLQNQSSVTYSSANPSNRYYQLAEISFGGQTVAIINTHLDSTNGGDNNRETQIHELVEATKNYDYCIILADSNIARVIDDQLGSGQYEQFNDYALLHGYGLYSLTNHGFQYGDIMTWPTTGTWPSYSNIPDYPHDFVIVKGFKTSNVVAVDNDLSDHCAFFCDLDIVGG